ncbi:hypothetical protein Tco_0227625 [Tanacetum coccineum]
MPPPDPNNIYIQPPSDDEDPETKMITVSKMVATRNHQPWRDILSVLNRCLTGKGYQFWTPVSTSNTSNIIVERSTRPLKMSKLLYTRFTKLIIDYILSHDKSIPRRSDSKLHSSQDDHPITKLRKRIPYYMAKKVESKKAKIIDEPEKQSISPVKSGRGKGFMCYGDQVVNVSNKLNKDVVQRKTRSLTIAEETVIGELENSISIQEPRSQQRQRSQLTIDRQTNKAIVDMYNEWGQKLKGPAIEDPTVYDATLKSSSSEESASETDDADKSDMDLSNDNPDRDDDAARYGFFMHNKPTATPNSTYLSLTVTSSLLDIIQTLLEDTPAMELTDFMSHPVYTNAQTILVVHNLGGNP